MKPAYIEELKATFAKSVVNQPYEPVVKWRCNIPWNSMKDTDYDMKNHRIIPIASPVDADEFFQAQKPKKMEGGKASLDEFLGL